MNDGNLEEGSFRCDANVSVRPRGSEKLGTRCELKNLNSFRFIKAAIEVEAARHIELIEAGGTVEQQTRLYDTQRNETRAMRSKEDAHDYRYFPDPDLPPLVVAPAFVDKVRAALAERPRARRERYQTAGLSAYDAGLLTVDRETSDFYDATARLYGDAKKLANWVLGEVSKLDKSKLAPATLAQLLGAVDAGRISNNAAKDVLAGVHASGKTVDAVIQEKGLEQVSDTSAIEAAVDAVLAASPSEIASYKAGKTQLLGFFVGKVMKAMKGKANPQVINAVLAKKLQ